MASELYHFIGGRRVTGTSGRYGDVYWPMTGEVAARVPLASTAEVGPPSTTPRPPSRLGAP